MSTGCLATAKAVNMKNSFDDRKAAMPEEGTEWVPSPAMTKSMFISNQAAIQENRHPMENVFSVLIVMETNQN